VGPSFNEQFDQHGAWRRGFAQQLHALREWLQSQELLDVAVQERLQRLEAQVRGDKVMVAFVAEFSRGKSELINAVFFAHYGRRLMPASAGRTTMCPAELGWEAELQPSLRLLPIDTRESLESLGQWRARPEAWLQLPLDVNNAQQIADTLARWPRCARSRWNWRGPGASGMTRTRGATPSSTSRAWSRCPCGAMR
jgi:hypothetical protein